MSQICLYWDEDTIQKGLVKALRNAAVDVTITSYLIHIITQEKKICGFRPPNPPILGYGVHTSTHVYTQVLKRTKFIVFAPLTPQSWGEKSSKSPSPPNPPTLGGIS